MVTSGLPVVYELIYSVLFLAVIISNTRVAYLRFAL